MPFRKALEQSEQIWTRVVASDSYDDNRYTTSATKIVVVVEVSDHSRGWPEGSLFDSYYTNV